MSAGDLDLISELLPGLDGGQGLPVAGDDSSSGNDMISDPQVDTTQRPNQVCQAEQDKLASETGMTIPQREYMYDWNWNVYGGPSRRTVPQVSCSH